MAVSLHFGDDELRCRGTECGSGSGCHFNGARQALCDALEQLRTMVGRPIFINSAYRCTIHNRKVGGVENSEHTLGLAADLHVPEMTAAQLEALALECTLITAIGRADKQAYIHIDVRNLAPGQERVRWCYDADGKWVPYFPATPVPEVTT